MLVIKLINFDDYTAKELHDSYHKHFCPEHVGFFSCHCNMPLTEHAICAECGAEANERADQNWEVAA